MYTKVTLVGYAKQDEQDVKTYLSMTSEELIERLKYLEESVIADFKEEMEMDVTGIKIEVVEEIGE